MRKLQTEDPIIIISWKFKWKVSSIENIDWDKVWVKWINEAKRALKWKWFVKKHLPINISNISYYDETKKVASKVMIEVDKSWKKVRKLKKTWLIVK